MKKELLRKIPKIDVVLMNERLFVFFEPLGREVVLETVRETLDEIRRKILDCNDGEEVETLDDDIVEIIIDKLEVKSKNSLRRTINATGIALHTNLGRAKLSNRACESVIDVARNYSTLEYDTKKGARGSRHDHIEKLITKITGAEGAMVVNNNAAATMLCLAAMAKDKEVIVSRGELVEIGGSFRIPDIMAESGATLVEVGATNKTKKEDYERAINQETGLLLKVHTSNYKIFGFTAEVSLEEMVELGKKYDLPVVYDMGSGLMVSLKEYGIDEPTVIESLAQGIDLILFSGDKLLGGPQGGILVGKKIYIDAMKKHPLARVVRVDKMVISAMEATFKEYLDTKRAMEQIPVLAMLSASAGDIKKRTENFALRLKKSLNSYKGINILVERVEDQVGGGSAPTVMLEGYGVAIDSQNVSAQKFERLLREFSTPIIARIYKDRIYFNLRTITTEEEVVVEEGIKFAFSKAGESGNA